MQSNRITRRLARNAVAAVGALLLGACATAKLQVEVSVLDPDYLDEFRRAAPIEAVERQARLAEAALADDGVLGQAAVNTFIANLEAQADAFDAKLREANRVAAGTPPLGPAIGRIARAGFDQARAELGEGVDAVQRARELSPDELDAALTEYRTAHGAFASARTTLTRAREGVEADLSQTRRVANDAGVPLTADQQNSIDAQYASTLEALEQGTRPALRATVNIDQEGSLRADPLLGYVLLAPEDGWTGVFNEAFATTYGSNADVAIVMDDIDKFSVKGLRADSSAATKATFAALGTVMSIAAAVSGVPVSGLIAAPPTQPEGEGASEQQAAIEQQLIVSRAELKARSQNARIDMIRLIDSVTAEGKTILDSGNGARIDDGARGRISVRLEAASK